MMLPMSRKRATRSFGAVPPARNAVKVPRQRAVGRAPGGDPLAHAPSPRLSRAPAERPAARPPNPVKPGLVRDSRGGALKDLFAIFPPLPGPARPAPRLQPGASKRKR
jgi:hypothetical protein